MGAVQGGVQGQVKVRNKWKQTAPRPTSPHPLKPIYKLANYSLCSIKPFLRHHIKVGGSAAAFRPPLDGAGGVAQ